MKPCNGFQKLMLKKIKDFEVKDYDKEDLIED